MTQSQSKDNKKDLTEGSVAQNLFNLATPMIFGIFAIMSISLADTYYVGLLGTKPLAALSFTFPVSLSIASLAIGLSAGAASVVSRAIGNKDDGHAKRLSTDSVILAFVIVLIISVTGYFIIRPLFSLMGANGEVLDMIERYMQIWYISMPFLVISMVANALIRAAGDSFWPSVVMISAAVINIGITPLFVFGWDGFVPAMDIEGAAIGTLIVRIFSLIFAGYLLIYREKMICLIVPTLEKFTASCREIIKIATPAAIGNMSNPVAIGILTAIIAAYGDEAVAAFGAATRLESFIAIPMLALSSAIGPIAGQNWGAGKKPRVLKALTQSFVSSVIWSVLAATLIFFMADFFASFFTNDENVQHMIALYLMIIPITLWGYGISVIAPGCFNAIGMPWKGLACYLTRVAVFYIPMGYAASVISDDLYVLFAALAVANVLAGISIGFGSWKNIESKSCD